MALRIARLCSGRASLPSAVSSTRSSDSVLQVPRRVEYALRAVILLAQKRDSGPQSFRDVASELDIPSEFLAKILRSLVRSGIVRSKRGAAGGYELVIWYSA